MEFLKQAFKISFSEVTVTPSPKDMPFFDPNYGFSEPRPTLQPTMTAKQMQDAEIPSHNRDICALDYFRWRKCCIAQPRSFFIEECNVERTVFDRCKLAQEVNAVKEYERERRLLKRRERILNKLAKEAKKNAESSD
ncbi:NADH dehydrogenase [ubiquinone] 1 beta subcomplex subunit 7-like [Convolutriloba macropyga]